MEKVSRIERRKDGEYDVHTAFFSGGNLRSLEVSRKGNSAPAFRNYLEAYCSENENRHFRGSSV